MHDESEHDGAEFLGRASEADEAIVKAVPIVLHSGGDEPGTGGAAIVGQQHAADDDGQPKGDPRVQAGLQRGDGSEHVTGEGHFGLLGFLRLGFLRSSRLRLSCWDFFCSLCCGCGRLDLRLAIRGSPGGVLVVTNSQHRGAPRFHQYQSILLHFALLNLIWHKNLPQNKALPSPRSTIRTRGSIAAGAECPKVQLRSRCWRKPLRRS